MPIVHILAFWTETKERYIYLPTKLCINQALPKKKNKKQKQKQIIGHHLMKSNIIKFYFSPNFFYK